MGHGTCPWAIRHAPWTKGPGPDPTIVWAWLRSRRFSGQGPGPMRHDAWPMDVSYVLWHVPCPMVCHLSFGMSYVLWPCPMSYGHVPCPMALSHLQWSHVGPKNLGPMCDATLDPRRGAPRALDLKTLGSGWDMRQFTEAVTLLGTRIQLLIIVRECREVWRQQGLEECFPANMVANQCWREPSIFMVTSDEATRHTFLGETMGHGAGHKTMPKDVGQGRRT